MRGLLIVSFILLQFHLQGQSDKPKLVVGIVVDQMRNDYIARFEGHFGEGGFKRLLDQGYQFKNAHYNYIPTYTGPGHASVYTGTTPRYHGIIANNWYSRTFDKSIYCAEDSTQTAVGGSGENGAMSPANMDASTISDQLRLTTNFRSKVVGVAIKDRGSILPAGHSANAAYWYDPTSGDFISSTYYMTELPAWVNDFNDRNLPDAYLEQSWTTAKPIETYVESAADDNDFERSLGNKPRPTFPYDLATISRSPNFGMPTDTHYGLIRTTPFGNTLTTEMAMAAVIGEDLGRDEFTDLLAVSFSSTDYVGHAFGPHSKEIQDTYIRLDQELERFFTFLDEEVGEGEYLVFLTADHAVVHVPAYLESVKVKGGYYSVQRAGIYLNTELSNRFGKGEWISDVSNDQIFLNRELVRSSGRGLEAFQKDLAEIAMGSEDVFEVYTATQMMNNDYPDGITSLLRNGYNAQRSGDVLAIIKPNHLGDGYGAKGTTHGTGFNYDTHVPMLFFGKGIKTGKSVRKVSITDIAPTLSMLLDISLPNAATGVPLTELFE